MKLSTIYWGLLLTFLSYQCACQQRETTTSGSGVIFPVPTQWGCYYYWSDVPIGNEIDEKYLKPEDMGIDNCFHFCFRDKNRQIAMIKGFQCFCTNWEFFGMTRILDDYCSFPCESNNQENRCGGNLGFSVYCNPAFEKCESNSQEQTSIPDYDLQDLEKYYDSSQNKDILKPIQESKQCLRCDTMPSTACFLLNQLSVRSDYFPQMDPISCVLQCRRTIKLDSRDTTFAVAYTTWWNHPDQGLYPVCACIEDYATNTSFTVVGEENCNTECPTQTIGQANCGNKDDPRTFMSAYCTRGVTGCLPLGGVEDADPGTSTDSSTSSTTTPVTTTSEGASSQLTSTESCTSTDSCTESSTTEASTRLQTTGTTSLVTFTTKASMTTEIASTEPVQNCSTKCRTTDSGREWEACPGKLATKLCVSPNVGLETWFCLENATFKNAGPDTSNCTSAWFQEVHEDFKKALEENNQTLPGDEVKRLVNATEAHIRSTSKRPYYGHEIKDITSLISQILEVSRVDFMELKRLVKKAMTLSGLMLSNKEPWEDFGNISARSAVGHEFFTNFEKSIFTLSKLVDDADHIPLKSDDMPEEDFFATFGLGNRAQQQALLFPNPAEIDSIEMDPGWEDLVPSTEKPVYVGYLVERGLYDGIFPPQLNFISYSENSTTTSKILNSKLISLTIKGIPFSLADKKVQITLQHVIEAYEGEVQNFPRRLHPNETRKLATKSAMCVYWSVSENLWSPHGCTVNLSTSTFTICDCNHLTSFAVLMDSHNYVGKDLGLEVLTFIFGSASVLCLLASVVVLSAVNAIQSQRTTITKHLCLCLMIGMILLLFLVDRHYFNLPMGLCIAVGILTHYIYLAAFVWMAIEGVHLYKMVVRVFDSGHSRTTIYRILAYGIPVLIVGITCVVGHLLSHQPYGGEMYCWLEGPYIWSFILPVGLVIVANMIILFVALKTAVQMRVSTASLQTRRRSYTTWIRGAFSITVLLGITWMPGFILSSPSEMTAKVASYIFVLLNSSQGIFLFIFHCFLNEKVRRVAGRNISLPSWLSITPSNSKDASQAGRRSENMGKYSDSEERAKYDPEPEPDLWFPPEPTHKRMTTETNLSRNWSQESQLCVISSNNSINYSSDRALKPTSSDSSESGSYNSGQRILFPNRRYK